MSALFTRRASFAPGTFSRAEGTVDAVLSTGAAVQRPGYTERLAITPEAVTVAPHLPVLDAHRQGSIADVLGRVDAVRFEGSRLIGTLRISNPQALDAIERGDVNGVSIGYRVATWNDTRAEGVLTRLATRWSLAECSLVPLPADAGAVFRSEDMSETTETTAAPSRPEVNAAIRDLQRRHALPTTWADTLVDAEAPLEEARAAALTAIEERSRATPAIRTQQATATAGDDREARVVALAHRMNPDAVKLTDQAAVYVHTSLIQHASELLAAQGVSTRGLSPDQLLSRSLIGLHTTSDFPLLLGSAISRVLMGQFEGAPSPIRQLFRNVTVPDFRPRSNVFLSTPTLLRKVNEAGEIKHGTLTESAETIELETYAEIIGLSRQLIINNDLGGLSDLNFGAAAMETENAVRAAFLVQGSGNGPVMSDGHRLFSPEHGNLAPTPSALTVESLSEARLAMRSQRDLSGKVPLGIAPKFLVVGPALETAGQQVLAATTAVAPFEVNPFSGALVLLVEPRIAGISWYLFADPASRPALMQGHLAGAPGPQSDTRAGWDVLGMEFRVYLDYGASALDWRGAFRNPGAPPEAIG